MIEKLFENAELNTALITLLIAVCSYLTTRVNKLKKKTADEFEAQHALIESTKRIALRNEYLQIYNSKYFTNTQKYKMTRVLVSQYYALNGNHYIHSVDEELKLKVEVNPDGIE